MSPSEVTLYYFLAPKSLVTRGRGENVKLLLEDAGIIHEYKRVSFGEWPLIKEELIKEGNLSTTLPIMKMDGKIYSNTVPILRHISKQVGNYLGSSYEEEQFLDTVADSLEDWFQNVKRQLLEGNPKDPELYFSEVTTTFLKRFERVYSQKEGPYILGKEISYPDFLAYHLLDEDSALTRLNEYPRLGEFAKAFESRKNIMKYLATVKGQIATE